MTAPPGDLFATPHCLCSLDENDQIVRLNPACPDHGSAAPPQTSIAQPWCPGSMEEANGSSCKVCRHTVPVKHGFCSVHLSDGSTPRE